MMTTNPATAVAYQRLVRERDGAMFTTVGSPISNPPTSVEHQRLQRQRDAVLNHAAVDEPPPIGHRLASQVEQDVRHHIRPGESIEQCLQRLHLAARANTPMVVPLEPRGTSYTNTRIGDASPWDDEE